MQSAQEGTLKLTQQLRRNSPIGGEALVNVLEGLGFGASVRDFDPQKANEAGASGQEASSQLPSVA